METGRQQTALPLVSVVTVCYNSIATIERTILSVLEQDYPCTEYIIIDGGSTDGTIEIIKKYEERLAAWTSEPDSGIYDAMNKGIKQCTGEWIHLLNSDDRYVNRNVLSRVVPQLDLTRTNYFSMLMEEKGRFLYTYRFPFSYWRMFVSAKLPHPALIVSKDQYARVGVYDTSFRIAADHEFILRLIRRYPPKFVDAPLVVMEQGGLSARDTRFTYWEFMEACVKNGLPRWVAILIYWIKRVVFRA